RGWVLDVVVQRPFEYRKCVMRFDGADEPASYPALLERITDAASRLRHVARGRGQRSLQDTAQGLGQVARPDFCSAIRIRDTAKDPGVPGWRTVAFAARAAGLLGGQRRGRRP